MCTYADDYETFAAHLNLFHRPEKDNSGSNEYFRSMIQKNGRTASRVTNRLLQTLDKEMLMTLLPFRHLL